MSGCDLREGGRVVGRSAESRRRPWTFRGDEWRHRRGRGVDVPWRRVAAAPRRGRSVATSRGGDATWTFRGDESRHRRRRDTFRGDETRRRRDVDVPWRRNAAAPRPRLVRDSDAAPDLAESSTQRSETIPQRFPRGAADGSSRNGPSRPALTGGDARRTGGAAAAAARASAWTSGIVLLPPPTKTGSDVVRRCLRPGVRGDGQFCGAPGAGNKRSPMSPSCGASSNDRSEPGRNISPARARRRVGRSSTGRGPNVHFDVVGSLSRRKQPRGHSRIAAPSRPRRGSSAETSRGDAAGAAWIVLGTTSGRGHVCSRGEVNRQCRLR